MFALPARRVSLIIAGILLLTTGVVFGDTYPRRRIGVAALYNPASHFFRSFPLTLLPSYTLDLNKRLGLGTGLTMLETMKTGSETIQTQVREFLMPVNMLLSLGRNKSKYETGIGMALTYQTNLSTDMENQTYPYRRMTVYPNFLLSGYRSRHIIWSPVVAHD